MFFVFLLSGLFLGWSLGANDAANVYGTAVGTRMIKFRTAAIACSVFVLIGAVVGGAGASHTLGKLGAVNALAGSFTVALAAGLTVTWMTQLKLPVSTSQAIVGAIIGWNLFTGSLTNYNSLSKIVSSWILCPLLSAGFAMILLKLTEATLSRVRLHILALDYLTRMGLFIVGAFASYSLGANNIANVMGVFVPSVPFGDLDVFGLFTLNGAQQLFALGGLAIGVGVFTFSKKVMLTVGNDLFKLSPIAALIVVLAQAIVLFLFSSEQLENLLVRHGLPSIPLVPVSSSQAVIGAVIGIGLMKGGRNIRFSVLGRISSGWISTPLISGVVSFVLLFIVQNVFSQRVYQPIRYRADNAVIGKLKAEGLPIEGFDGLVNQTHESAAAFQEALRPKLDAVTLERALQLSRLRPLKVDLNKVEDQRDLHWLSEARFKAIEGLAGRDFEYTWQMADALSQRTEEWKKKPIAKENKLYNKKLRAQLDYLARTFERR
ncbi:inorganic phosphate transporter family protein [Myxococcota bacterium]|nr:inorganic phosphate transporter family protein [Myxococcota bacterium]MBU1432875.1 inorganic phosphate transporter family protein [Myxococcota bacterium]MBU1898576.1 inorganic phosphate transporter family protein [Myxococcota bacterium]